MDPGLSSDSIPPPPTAWIDKSKVLDIKPLRFLVPIFPHQSGNSSIFASQPSPFACFPPAGPFPSGVQPFYPFLAKDNTQHGSFETPRKPANLGVGSNKPANLGVGSNIPANFGAGSQPANFGAGSQPASLGVGSNIPAPVPLNSFGTPSFQGNGGGGIGKVKRPRGRPKSVNKVVNV